MTIRQLWTEAHKTLLAIEEEIQDVGEPMRLRLARIQALAEMLGTILHQIAWQLRPAVRQGPLSDPPPLRDAFDDDAADHVASQRCPIVKPPLGDDSNDTSIPPEEWLQCRLWRNHEGDHDFAPRGPQRCGEPHPARNDAVGCDLILGHGGAHRWPDDWAK